MNSEDQRLDEEGVANLAREMEPILNLWITLVSDVAAARAAMVSNDTQFARRQFVRATFAKLEGFTSALKQLCLRSPRIETDYSAAEIALLREETFSLDDNGETRRRSNLRCGELDPVATQSTRAARRKAKELRQLRQASRRK